MDNGECVFSLECDSPLDDSTAYKAYLRLSARPFELSEAQTRTVRFVNPGAFNEGLGANYIGELIFFSGEKARIS